MPTSGQPSRVKDQNVILPTHQKEPSTTSPCKPALVCFFHGTHGDFLNAAAGGGDGGDLKKASIDLTKPGRLLELELKSQLSRKATWRRPPPS
jgi:hypothetical protein